MPSSVGKWNLHHHKVGQQQEAWSALEHPGIRLCWPWTSGKHSGPTPADDMAAQTITDCGNFTLDLKQHGLCASPLFLQTLGPWFPKEMQNVLSSENITLGPLSSSPVLFVFSPGRDASDAVCCSRVAWHKEYDSWNPCLAYCLCVVVLEALTPAAVHSLWISPTFLNGFCFTILSRDAVIPIACTLFSTTSFPSLRLSINMLGHRALVNSQPLLQWPFVSCPPSARCQWSSFGQLSS